MASAHSSLLSVVDEGIAGVDSAVEGLNVYVNDPYYRYWDARDTPGWITFSSASDRITGQLRPPGPPGTPPSPPNRIGYRTRPSLHGRNCKPNRVHQGD